MPEPRTWPDDDEDLQYARCADCETPWGCRDYDTCLKDADDTRSDFDDDDLDIPLMPNDRELRAML